MAESDTNREPGKPPPRRTSGRSAPRREDIGGRSVKLRSGDDAPELSSEKLAAKGRIKAAKLSTTSVALVAASPVAFFCFGTLPTVVVGVLAIVVGARALIGLAAHGSAPASGSEQSGLVRVSGKMTKGAATRAWLGIAGGAGLIVFPLVLKLVGSLLRR